METSVPGGMYFAYLLKCCEEKLASISQLLKCKEEFQSENVCSSAFSTKFPGYFLPPLATSAWTEGTEELCEESSAQTERCLGQCFIFIFYLYSQKSETPSE